MKVEKYRIMTGPLGSTSEMGNNGAFIISNPYTKRRELCVICSDGMGWDHVSVHIDDTETHEQFTPTWDEMCYIKDLFWEEEEAVMQFHPPHSVYVNNHPNTLHLWKPQNMMVMLPPSILVGVKGVTPQQAIEQVERQYKTRHDTRRHK